MNNIKTYEDLIVWQKAHNLVLKIYSVTKTYPKEELYCLVSQMRRSVISVPANIVEGYSKIGIKDKLRFYNISQGSLQELRYFLMLSKDLDYTTEYNNLILQVDEVAKLIQGYINSIKQNTNY